MRTVIVPLVVLVGLVAVAVAQWAHHVPRLPDRVAVHVGPSGEVDGWQSKADFVAGTATGWLWPASILGGVAALNVLGVWLAPPPFVNVPNRDYWLGADGRRGELVAVVGGFWLGALATGVAGWVVVNEGMFRASFTGRGTWFDVPAVLGLVAALFAQIVWLVVRLRRPR